MVVVGASRCNPDRTGAEGQGGEVIDDRHPVDMEFDTYSDGMASAKMLGRALLLAIAAFCVIVAGIVVGLFI
jgi:hypothetical protein